MGVPKFYRYISERYPSLSEVVREYQIPEFDNLYLDMNGIIHNCSHPNDDDVHFRISEEMIFKDIFRYIEFLFRMIKPRKVFFMAIDGVAPRAKMNQQRGRRFRSAKEAEDREKEALRKGEVLPQEKRFDSNCITPGTEFMDRLHQHLKYFVAHKISTDDLWRDVKVILSGHETPGEGEHKIMDFIRYEKSQPGYDPNTRHCLYGLDADLIMLGMCSHEPHFSLLREEVKYIKKSNEKSKRDSNPEAITFHLLHLSLFREYIDHEFEVLKTTLPFEYNLENIIDDWVLMGFLVGNDFIPHIPHFHINKNSLLQLYETYKQVMPTLDGYLNEDGKLNLLRFQKYLNELTKIDIEHFNDTYADLKYFESKTGRKLVQRKLEDTSAFFETDGAVGGIESEALEPEKLIELDDNEDNEDKEGDDSEEIYDSSDSDEDNMFMQEFKSHKRDYYMSKLNYKKVDESVLKEQAYEYIRALQWNLHYYYNGCMSWGWFYPHHYAPYISDVKNFDDIDLNFEMGQPFKPFEQLLAVLPSASKELLPKAFEPLVSNPNSQLIDYYPEDFETDQNEKQQAWEAVVLIPFIDEKRLLNAVQSLEQNLTPDEMRRNKHGPHLVFTYSQQTTQPINSPNPTLFPDITTNHSVCQLLDSDAFRIPVEQIHKGLCEGVRMDVYIRGFPTLKHIPHDAILSKERVRVFESASMNENMMLVLKNQEDHNLEDVAYDYIDQTVFVNWPHLIEAKVIKVSNDENKYYMVGDQMICKELEDREYKETRIRINAGVKKYRERWGVVVMGDLKNKDEVYNGVVIHALPVTGRKYVMGSDGKTSLEKEYSSQAMLCPIETTVKDIDILEHEFSKFETFEEIFSKGTKCFPIDDPYYGSMAQVIDCLANEGLVKVKVSPQYEPDLSDVQNRTEEILREKYMPNHELANRLNMSRQLCSRMLGTIFIKAPEGETRNRINIGLNLKFNAKNEQIPGFSLKMNDTWYFSEKVYNIMNDYYNEFPFIFDNLATCIDKDYFTIDDLIPGDDKRKTLDKLVKWLRNLESAQEKRQRCNAEILDEFVVKELEDIVHTHIVFPVKELPAITVTYKPNQLYRPIHHLGYSLPDPRTRFELFDRVVNVRSGISVPLGAKGTIIGKHIDTNNEVNTLYDIVFDEEFVGGIKLRCTPGKGFKLSPANLINITFGLKLTGKYDQFVSSGGQPLQARAQHNYQQRNRGLNYNQSNQYNARFNSGSAFGQRMPRPNMPHVPPFAANANPVNLQTSLSIQTLNHSKTSPFQSPKHENQNATNMQQIWKSMVNNTNMLPKPPMPSTDHSLPQSYSQVTQPKQILENKSRSNQRNPNSRDQNQNPRDQRAVAENKRSENMRQQNASQSKPKTNIEFVETYRQTLVRYCLQLLNQSPPKFEVVSYGPMNAKMISLSLPDRQSFRTSINMHPSIDEAYEYISLEALKYLNGRYNANINLKRPKHLSSPSFIFNQTSPNRPRVAESSLPRPPSRWIAQQRPVVPVFESLQPKPTEIPDSFVEHNTRLLNERRQRQAQEEQRQQQRHHSGDNANFLPSNPNQIRKKLFDTRSDFSQNMAQNPRMILNRNQNQQRDGNNGGQSTGRRQQNPRQAPTGHAAFENRTAFVPLQVARNNQSHRSPHKKEDVEILTPESVRQISGTPNDDIQILTPESLNSPQTQNSSNRKRQSRDKRSSRLGVDFGH